MPSPYADLSRPPMREPTLRRGLVGLGGLWTDLRIVDETGSTNADVADVARHGTAQGLVLVAESQRTGRGRLDRAWQAPVRSAITMSVLLRPPVPVGRLGWLPLLAGVALAEAVDRVGAVDAALKWPNDLLVRPTRPESGGELGGDGYGKGAGILGEAVAGDPPGVVLGIGLNVSQRADELPMPADPRAYRPTSLALAGGSTDRVPLLRATLRAIETWYGRWCDAAGDADACGLRDAYRARCVTIDREVEVSLPGGEMVPGRVLDVDSEGRLLVAEPGGAGIRALAAGDVHHVR